MFKSEEFGKLILAVRSQDIDAALRLLAADFCTEIKDITRLPQDMNLISTDLAEMREDKQDFSVQDYKVRIMENKLAESGERINFIMKKLDITPRRTAHIQYEFHVRNLEDLVDKILATTNEIHDMLQDNLNKQATNNNAIEQAGQDSDVIKTLSSFAFNKTSISNLQYIDVREILVFSENYEFFKNFLVTKNIFHVEKRVSEREVFFLVPAPKKLASTITESMTLYNAREFSMKDEYFLKNGEIDPDSLSQEYQDLIDQREELFEAFKNIKTEYAEEIQALYELNINALNFLQYHKKMYFFKEFVIAEFWVQLRDWPSLEAKLKELFGDRIKYSFIPVKRHDVPVEEGETPREQSMFEKPPTLIRVPNILKPYTTVLKLYGIPKYNEISPLIFIFFTFPLLFGLMFGDVGQGIILIAVGLIASRLKLSHGWHNFTLVIFWCGIGAIAGGFIYGEFFGIGFQIPPGGPLSPHVFPIFRPFGEEANVNDVMRLLIFALFIGSIQISLGFILRGVNYIITKRKFFIISDVFPKISLLWLAWSIFGTLGIDFSIFGAPSFFESFTGIYLIISFILLFFGNNIGKLLHVPYLKKKKAGGLLGDRLMDGFESILSMLSNVVSYARIFGLCMVHLALMYAVTIIAMQIGGPNPIFFGIAYGVGNGLVIVLELLLVTIQNIRLHFYEFFSKFYDGNGKEFNPMKYDIKFSRLYFDNEEVFLIKE